MRVDVCLSVCLYACMSVLTSCICVSVCFSYPSRTLHSSLKPFISSTCAAEKDPHESDESGDEREGEAKTSTCRVFLERQPLSGSNRIQRVSSYS